MSALELLYAERDRRRSQTDAAELTQSLTRYVQEAWHVLKPAEDYLHNWHIEAICEHLEAVSAGEIKRLQIWIPRGTMKSLTVSVLWPTWEWTRDPGLRYWTASYELGLARRLSRMSLLVLTSDWYTARWGHKFRMLRKAAGDYGNNKGGTRLATAPGSTALGEHGHRIIIDDAINAGDADATSRATLDETNSWYDRSIEGSKARPKTTAEVIIMQRLHEDDLAAHVYNLMPEEWTVLCLPERYEADHPHRWPKDPRTEGELLWPEKRDEKNSELMARTLGAHRAAGQMQQRPSAREGEILKRHWWRFYNPRLFTDDRHKKRRPSFRMVVQSLDCPLKDKNSSDQIAIQAWGVHGSDRYLLDLKAGQMSYGQAKRATIEQARYVRTMFRKAAHHVLIENAGYGVELFEDLKRELTGVKKLSRAHEGDKILRAESAAADLESGNCFLPGYRTGADELSLPDEARCAADIRAFIDECAAFPNGRYDDQVDAWSQAMNWLRSRTIRRPRTWSSFATR